MFDYELPSGVFKSHFPEHNENNMDINADISGKDINDTGASDTDVDVSSASKDAKGIDVICTSFLKKHFEDSDSINQIMANDMENISDSKTSDDSGAVVPSGTTEEANKDTSSGAENKKSRKKVEFELPFELPDSLCAPTEDAEPVDANEAGEEGQVISSHTFSTDVYLCHFTRVLPLLSCFGITLLLIMRL